MVPNEHVRKSRACTPKTQVSDTWAVQCKQRDEHERLAQEVTESVRALALNTLAIEVVGVVTAASFDALAIRFWMTLYLCI